MAKNFEVDRNKNKQKNPHDVSHKDKERNASENWRHKIKMWTAFYRENPHRFCKDYLGINLHLFQYILIFLMDKYSFFMWVASRGVGKSFLIAVYCVVRCILYPGSMVVLASGTKGQAKLIVTQKIQKILMSMSPNLCKEIKSIKTSSNECIVYFHNGSSIEAVTSSDNARGYRGNILILDEFRLIDKDVVNKVLRPFLNVVRTPPYAMLPEYADFPQEENKEIYISSAYYKNNWMWDSFKSFKNAMIEGKDYFVLSSDYKLPMHHGLLSKKRIEQIKSEDDFDPISFIKKRLYTAMCIENLVNA